MENMDEILLAAEEMELPEELIAQEELLTEAPQELMPQQEQPIEKELPQSPQEPQTKPADRGQKAKAVLKKTDYVISIIVNVLYKHRKDFMAAPVVYYAVKLALYNNEHLPSVVGVDLQANGVFGELLSHELAEMGPLAVPAVCLVLMFLSRKSMYAWAISIFSLALPIVLLLSNRYPA